MLFFFFFFFFFFLKQKRTITVLFSAEEFFTLNLRFNEIRQFASNRSVMAEHLFSFWVSPPRMKEPLNLFLGLDKLCYLEGTQNLTMTGLENMPHVEELPILGSCLFGVLYLQHEVNSSQALDKKLALINFISTLKKTILIHNSRKSHFHKHLLT